MGRKETTPEEQQKIEEQKIEEQKNPRESAAGEVQLTPEDLGAVAGGDGELSTEPLQTWGCCNGVTDNAGTCFPCTRGSACAPI